MRKQETFIEKLYECNRHKEKLLTSSQKLKTHIPFTLESYENISDEVASFIDQMIFRFSKLQDTMGDKLFPAFLELIGEDIKSWPFIDRLNRMEELEILIKDEWMALRKNRNEIAHEYSFNKTEIIESIHAIYESLKKLIHVYDGFFKYCNERFEFVRNAEVLKNNTE